MLSPSVLCAGSLPAHCADLSAGALLVKQSQGRYSGLVCGHVYLGAESAQGAEGRGPWVNFFGNLAVSGLWLFLIKGFSH